MGFSLKKLVQGAVAEINPFDHGQTFQSVQKGTPPPASTARPQQNIAQRVVQANPVSHIASDVLSHGADMVQKLGNSIQHNPVGGFVNDNVIKPIVTTDTHASQLLSGHNPYHGTAEQIVGQVGQDALNAASVLPIGKGAELAAATTKLAPRVAEGAKLGLGAGAVFGGAQGAASSLQNNDSFKDVLKNAGIGGAEGAALGGVTGAAAPIVGKVLRKTAGELQAGLPAARNEGGYIATPDSVNFDKYVKKGKPVTTFPDGLQGVEISDKNMKVKPEGVKGMLQGHEVPLDNVLDHPKQKADYPFLYSKDTGVKVKFDAGDNTVRGSFDPTTNTVHVNPNIFGNTAERMTKSLQSDQGRKVLAHEVSHAIDTYSGVGGTNPTDIHNSLRIQNGQNPSEMDVYRAYNKTPAEQRALTGEDRINMSQRQIDKNPLGQQPQPFRLPGSEPGIGDRMAAMKNPELTPREIRQGIADGVLHPDTPIPPSAPSNKAPRLPETPKRGRVVENALTSKGKLGKQNISPELQAKLSGEHEVRSTQALQDEAVANANKAGLDKTIQSAHDALSVKDGSITDKDVALAHQAIERADQAGRLEDANAIHDALSNHLRQKGQDIQAATLLYQRSPQGMLYSAFKTLKKGGVEVTPAIKKELQDHIDGIKALPDGAARDFAKAAFGKALAKHIPQGKLDNVVGVWKAGLLSGIKTQGGNFISNATFAAGKKIADPIASGADKAFSLATGKRTKTTTAKGLASGTKEGLKTAKTTLKTGIDARNNVDKYEQHAEINFKNPTIQKMFGTPANYIFRGMNAADQPFYYSAFKNSLYDQAKAEGLNKNLKGSALKDYMDKIAKNPSLDMANTAQAEAAKSVLGYDTIASKAISGVHKSIDNMEGLSPAGKQTAHAVINILAPFTRVPSAFLSRTVDFTPLGIGKETISQISKGKFNQRLMSQAIGEGLTGTGAIALGMVLSKTGQLSGDYPKNDPKEQARWKAEGITPNSVKIGGKWVSLNYGGPVGLLFGMGKRIVDAGQGGASAPGQIGAAIAGLGSGLLGQSFLQGFSGFSDAIKDPTQNAATYIKSEIGSLVPNLVNDSANVTDPLQRQANSPTDALKAKIPGLRETLNPKLDPFGNDLGQAAGGANAAFNPLKPSNDTSNDLTREIDRLKNTGKENFVIPTPDKTIQVGNQTIKLNGDQQYTYNKFTGQQIQKVWNDIIKSPEYAGLSDDDKANALRTAMQDANATSKVQMLSSIGKDDLAKTAADKLTNNQYKILTGGAMQASDYAVAKSPSGTRGSSDPKSAYQTALTSYNRKKSTLSDPEKLKTEKSLSTLKIKSDYSQEVIDFYNLSNADKSAYFKRNPDKAKQLYGQAQELSQKLSSAGLTAKKVSTSTKTGGSKSTKAKKSTFDYTKRLATSTSSATKDFSAIRNLVKKSTGPRKSTSGSVKLKKVTIKKTVVKK